jgi:hypothetical protein
MAIPKVTVGIPTWNGERFIEAAIRSVLTQVFTDLEIIVVDDQSADSTPEIVRSFSDPRITFCQNEQQLGIPGNWNRTLTLARGEYVCVFHQDDLMCPENLLRKTAILDDDPNIGFVHSAIAIVIEPSAPYLPSAWVENSDKDFIVDGAIYFRRLLLEGNLICAPTVVARRDVLLRAGGFDSEFGFACDYALWARLCLDQRVAFLSEPLVQYRWHADNESHRYRFLRGVQEISAASRRLLSHYREQPGLEQDANLLEASVDALTRVRTWAAELECGKAWLEGQVQNWQGIAAERERTIADLQAWNTQLETAKAWLDAQVQNWQGIAAERERTIADLQAWNTQLETAKAWLDAQVQNWQGIAAERERSIDQYRERLQRLNVRIHKLEGHTWTRLGRHLRILEPSSFVLPAKQSKDNG